MLSQKVLMLTDTHPEAEAVLNGLLRRATIDECLARTVSLTQLVRDLSRQGIVEAHPNLSPQDRNLLFVEVTYGREWANRLRAYFGAAGPC